jgi:predicted metalloprotease with PDZ domain
MTIPFPVLEAATPLPPWQEIHRSGNAFSDKTEEKLFDGIEVGRPPAEASKMEAVLITGVKEGSPASWSGFIPGMLILEIDGVPVDSIKTFQKIASEKKNASSSVFWTKQNGRYSYIVLQSNSTTP